MKFDEIGYKLIDGKLFIRWHFSRNIFIYNYNLNIIILLKHNCCFHYYPMWNSSHKKIRYFKYKGSSTRKQKFVFCLENHSN